MNQIKPFLTHFAKDRLDVSGEKHELHYNEDLDINEISIIAQEHNNDFAGLSTTTRVKSEAPDIISITTKRIEYLAAHTITEVKPEKPDFIDPFFNSVS